MSDLNFDIFTTDGIVPVPTFRRAVENSIYLLNQFDAGLSKHSRGVLRWFVDGIKTTGNGNGQGPHHFSIHFISDLKVSKKNPHVVPEFAPQVTREFVHGVTEIAKECETPRFLSENAMERVAEFGTMVAKKNASGFRFSTEDQSVDLTPDVAINVERLIGTRTNALGTVTGRLEALDIHKGYKAKLYHEITSRVVTCIFDEKTFRQATRAFGKLVYVSGVLHKNLNGDTIRVTTPDIEIVEDYRCEMPNGYVVPSYADAPSTAEYMRRIRGG